MSVLTLDIGGSKISAAVFNKKKLSKIITHATNSQAGPQKIMSQIIFLIDTLMTSQIKAITLGVPGWLDEKRGFILDANNIPAFKKLALKKELTKKYKLPIFIENDANCFALGEKYFGQGKKYQHIAALTLGTGLGTGLIINGQLYRGSHGGAGEFGQLKYQNGILEDYTASRFFIDHYNSTAAELLSQALDGKANAKKAFNQFGSHLGQALSIISYVFDPELFIFGGSIAKAFRFFSTSMKNSFKKTISLRRYQQTKIIVSQNPHSALLGAAYLASQNK